MQIVIKGKQMHVTPQLRQRIERKVQRLSRLVDEESRVEANRNAEKISAAALIAAPSMPEVPARPRRKLVAFGTLLAGLLLGFGAVFAVEAFDDRMRTPHDVTNVLRLPVLATFGKET